MSEQQYDVFLSHNRQDADAVLVLARRLRDDAHVEPFLDTWHLIPGEPWQEAIERALDASQACAVFLGPSGLGTWDNEQMRAALDIRAANPEFRVIPVLLPGGSLPERGKLPRFLARLTWVDFRAGLDDAAAFHALVSGIKGVAPGTGEVAGPSVCPFRGLQVFEEENAEFFFGREALAQHLVEALREDRFLAVSGPSGSGKSSLVRAGVIPRIRAGALPGSAAWDILLFKPGTHPLDTLAAQVVPLLGAQLDPIAARDSLLGSFRRDERGLHNAVQVAVAGAPPGKRVLVIADQFEEVFTLCRDETERAAFISNLLYAASIPGGQTLAILTLRSDFLGRCTQYPDLAARLSRLALVGPMDQSDLRRAMTAPAEKVGLFYEKGLVETILDDLGSEPGLLPLLQHTLLELWERRRGAWLTTDAYHEIGGVRGALSKRADAIYASLTPAQQHAARSILLRLTQPGEGSEDTRRHVELTELLPEPAHAADSLQVIQQLADARLLTTSKDEHGAEIVDVSHEALIRNWPLLRGWIDTDREALRTQQRVTEAAAEWAAQKRDPSYLYRGARLAAAEEWSNAHPDVLNPLEQEFIKASLDARDHERAAENARREQELASAKALAEAEAGRVAIAEERAREQSRAATLFRRLAFGLAGLVVLAVILAGVALYLNDQSNRARALALSRQRAYASISTLPVNPERALVVAVEAGRTARTFEVDTALRQAIAAAGQSRTYIRVEPFLRAAQLSPDGKRVAIVNAGASLWDAATGAQLQTLPVHSNELASLAWSKDSSQLATGSNDGSVQLWDGSTGQLLREFKEHQAPVNALSLNDDATRLVTGDASGKAIIWDVRSGSPIVRFGKHTDNIEHVAWDPKYERVLSASDDGTARIWDAKSGQELAVLQNRDRALDAEWDPAGARIASAGFEGKPRIWDAATGNLLLELPGHTSAIWRVRWSPDGSRLATASSDGTARVWDAVSGAEQLQVSGGASEEYFAEWDSNGERILTGGSDGIARVWNSRTGNLLAALKAESGLLNAVAWDRDDARVFTASVDGSARLWDPEQGHEGLVLRARAGQILDAAWNSSAGRILTVGSDMTPRVWDAADGALITELRGHTAPVRQGAFSHDGKRIVTASYDRTARVWDSTTGVELLNLSGHTEGVWTAFWNADDSQILTAGLDKTARVWDIKGAVRAGAHQANTLVTLELAGGTLNIAVWSPDEKRILTGSSDGMARIWDAKTGSLLLEQPHSQAILTAAAWSPDGARIVTGYSDGAANVLDAVSGAKIAEFREHTDDIKDVAWDKAGKRIVTASLDGTTGVWDGATGRQLFVLGGHRGAVNSAAWSPDEAQIVTAGADGTARIWDASTGAQVAVLIGHNGPVRRALWIADGTQILTASEDGTARVYFVRLDDLLKIACERASRNLTLTEWQQYFGGEAYRETCPGKPSPGKSSSTP